MAIYRSVVIFESVTGLPKDRVTNRYHFSTSEGAHAAATATLLNGHVANAYETITAPGTVKPSTLLSAELSRVVLPQVKTYNPAGGSPLAVDTFAAFSAAAHPQALPSEIACCMSINADVTDIPEEAVDDADADAQPERPAARRRGRIFFGPLVVTAVAGTAPERPSTGLKNALLGLAKYLNNPVSAGLIAINTELVVRSDSGFGGASYPVVRASVDDTFDTQRRRGVAATGRVTLAI